QKQLISQRESFIALDRRRASGESHTMADASSPPAQPGKVEPYIPASKSLPELTVGVIILGGLLSVILGGANAYLGMFAGMTVSASVPAAVISMGILRALRTGN